MQVECKGKIVSGPMMLARAGGGAASAGLCRPHPSRYILYSCSPKDHEASWGAERPSVSVNIEINDWWRIKAS